MWRQQNLGLQRRIMLYVSLGLVFLLALFTYFARGATQEGSRIILRERLALARTVAHEVDAMIGHLTPEIERFATLLASAGPWEPSSHADSMARALHEHLGTHQEPGVAAHLGVFRADGALLWLSPHTPADAAAAMFRSQAARRALASGQVVLADDARLLDAERASLLIAAPARTDDGTVHGLLIADLLPTHALLRFVQQAGDGNSLSLELVTPQGTIAAAQSEAIARSGNHLPLVASLVRSGRAGIVDHVPARGTRRSEDHIVAFAPLSAVGWGVLLEQREDVALKLPQALERRLTALSVAALIVGLTLAWFTTRQVVRPLERLTDTAHRIAAGDLDSPVETGGQDEVRLLASSFEKMRQQLRQSRDEIEQWNRELEERVAERTEELKRLYAELAAKDEQRTDLLRKVIMAQEEERKRVARELHDEVGQLLSGLQMDLASAAEAAPESAGEARGRLTSLQALVGRTVAEVRRLISDLRPSILDDLGLVEAIGWFAETHLPRTHVDITAAGMEQRLPSLVELVIFRIVQEALTNVARHSRAAHAEVRLSAGEDAIAGTVTDDGVGFDPAEHLRRGRSGVAVGLLGMRERVSLLGGALDIVSAPGQGTRIAFQIPREGREAAWQPSAS